MTTFPLTKVEEQRLASCDPQLQALVFRIIEDWNIQIIEGHRDKATQDKAFAEGKSQLRWPQGKHNSLPSKAIDMIPIELVNGKETLDWKDRERMSYFAGYVIATAKAMGSIIRWGGDWDRDTQVKDNSFDDLVHFELLT